jgi:undecaprenyl diphosphate synthase
VIERAPVATGVPHHVAIIMDGNRRWARANGVPAIEGHRRGMQALERTVDAALRAGIRMLTVYAFSEENWSRERGEVFGLFGLAESFAREKGAALAARGVRVRVIGRRDRLPRGVVEARLWTAGFPDPDLVVRTGGELRLSNFLLYQCAYAELWSTTDPWPDFDANALGRAIDAYATRERRFGR